MTDIYRALGDPTRRSILRMLGNGSRTQKEIVEAFTISQPAIKKHLKILLEEQLIFEKKQGKFRVYSLDRDLLKLAFQKMFAEIGDLLDNQLMSLKEYVEEGENRYD